MKLILLLLLTVFAALLLFINSSSDESIDNTNNKLFSSNFNYNHHIHSIDCIRDEISLGQDYSLLCLVNKNNCSRHIIDDYFSIDEIDKLHLIADKGMSTRPNIGGPTILDINTGYIRDSNGLENLFSRNNDIYDTNDFNHYNIIINKLRDLLLKTFDIEDLYFTAPTFITRLDGNQSWSPQGIHDEYWHPHSDMINTPHYHYSGLLYMSDYNIDFNNGRLLFVNYNLSTFSETSDYSHLATLADQIIEPKRGRVVLFTSGKENTHFVERVNSGQRFVLAFWFTCNLEKQFEIFLDGKEHKTFSYKIKNSILNKMKSKSEL